MAKALARPYPLATANPNISKWEKQLEAFDANGCLGWAFWAWTNNPAFKFSNTSHGVLPPDPRKQGIVYNASLALEAPNLAVDMAKALARPYPLAHSRSASLRIAPG